MELIKVEQGYAKTILTYKLDEQHQQMDEAELKKVALANAFFGGRINRFGDLLEVVRYTD